MLNRDDYRVVHKHIEEIIPKLQRKAEGYAIFPWVAGAYGPPYGNSECFWDAFHECLRFIYGGQSEWMKYLLDNHLHYQNPDNGWMPGHVMPAYVNYSYQWMCQPFVIQGAAVYARMSKDWKWLEKVYPALKNYLRFWCAERQVKDNLFCWWGENGFDNDVSTAFFQPRTVAAVSAGSFLYMEHAAMSFIARLLKKNKDSETFRRKSEDIKKEMNERMWFEKLSCYANIDIRTGAPVFSLGLESDLNATGAGKYSFLTWNYMLALYAGIAPKERAKKMIETYLLNPRHFWSPNGIRTLSGRSEYYNNAVWGNPARYSDMTNMTASNWQGPVWFPVNYFMFHSLLNYGYKKEAEELADKTLHVIAEGIRKKGCMFENYNAETGEPLYAPEFGSWNILADQMHKELDTDKWILDFLCR